MPNGQIGSIAETGSTGVEIVSASGNVVGGSLSAALTPTPGAGNVISGNAADGVHIIGTLTDPANTDRVEGNFIGVGASGNAALGNGRYGVEVSGANNASVGGEAAGVRNVIGGNLVGVMLDNGARNNFVQQNFVGVGADGTTAVGNTLQGVALRSNDAAAPPLGPGQPNEPGVQNNLIGGLAATDANVIAFNGTAGVAVFGNPISSSGQPNVGNSIEGNSIFLNGRAGGSPAPVGIDLSNGFPYPKEDGATANDSKGHGAPNDPNNFQDSPTLASAILTAAGVYVQGAIAQSVAPDVTYRLEFFASNPDPLGLPAQGQTFLGFTTATTGANGALSFGFVVSGAVAPGQSITATATNVATGDTSEFSPGVALVIPPTANAAFVGKVYQVLLGRAPSSAEAAGWVAPLDKGASTPAQTALAIETDSRHEYYTDLVQSFYAFYLHRPEGPSDGASASNFVDLLAGGGSIEQVRALFVSSPEYFQTRAGNDNTNFVNAAYLDAFGTPNRVATDPNAQADVTALNNHTKTRQQVADGLFASTEYRNDLVQSFYQLALFRTGSSSEIAGWASLLQQGASDQVVLADILASAESYGKAGPFASPLAPGSGVTEGVANLSSPIFANTPLNGRADLQGLYIFRSPADPQPPNPDAANFGNTVIAVTLSPFAGVQTPMTFDPRVTVIINAVNVQGHTNPDFSFIITFAPPISNAPNPGSSQVVTVNLKQGATTTLIAQYTYNTTQTIPPAAFPNNITFPGDAIATGKFIAGDFDNPAFFDAQGYSNFAATGLNPPTAAHPLSRPAPHNPARPLPTDAQDFYGPNANVLGLVFEVPTTKLTTANPPLLGVWATTSVNGTQVARLGRPDVGTLLIPPLPRNDLSNGGERRTAFNLGSPATDVANFRAGMQAVLESPKFIYQRSQADATALTDTALGNTIVGPQTGLLPNILTVDLSKQYLAPGNGFFNGLRLRDDAINIMLRVLENNPSATDNVFEDNGNRITDGLFGTLASFPFIGRPNNPAAGPNA